MKKLIICLSMVFLVGLAGSVVCFSGAPLTSKDLGVSFRVSSEQIYPGDTISIYVDINNPTQETFRDVPLFAVWATGPELKPQNAFYFPAPRDGSPWLPADVHYYKLDVPPGITEIELLAPYVWPEMPGFTGTPMVLFSGMSDPLFEKVFGTSDWLTIYFH